MSYMSKLNITQLKRPAKQSPAEERRGKLVAKLEEQLALAQAQAEGKSYVVTKPAWTRDDQGNKTRVQRERAVRAWWWNEGTGLAMVVRYGARPLELSKGKRALSIENAEALPEVINTVIAAASQSWRVGCANCCGDRRQQEQDRSQLNDGAHKRL